MSYLDEKENNFILKAENAEKRKRQIVTGWILMTIVVFYQATKAILTGFTKYKLLDSQTLALENATFWIFLLILAIIVRRGNIKYLHIVKKLMNALESKTESNSEEKQ